MPVKKDPSGRRYVEAEAEVPGTPEQVWDAIATGPGISSWFVPTQVEEREGGTVTSQFGVGDSVANVTEWNPPHRFVATSPDLGEHAATVATEWVVEARDGGTCVVRVVHSWFADTDQWDKDFEGHEHGWREFFRILRLYLTHFRGHYGAILQVLPVLPEPKDTAWAALMSRLGLPRAPEVGQRIASSNGAPAFAGVVEHVGEGAYPESLFVRLDAPAPGLAHLFAMAMGGQVFLIVRLYLFGDKPAALVAREEPAWKAHLASMAEAVKDGKVQK
ncbi:SRPBCC domain-containing protein [Pendulispora rubella]|uniref:SRPBCC domain-containing protein n=1 Tax=Pendulispora rubella TaxID=2741070 RepID=A0ABZ2KSC9_9BACT